MTDIICPLCGKPNPPDLEECKYCQAPLKTGGFIAPSEDKSSFDLPGTTSDLPAEEESKPEEPETPSNLEQAIPDWLKATEASFLEGVESETPKGEPEGFTSDQLSDQIDSLINMPSTPPSTRNPAIDDEWLSSLLAEAGAGEPDQESLPEPSPENVEPFEAGGEEPTEAEQPAESLPVEKPDWLTSLEASSTIKIEGTVIPHELEQQKEVAASEPQEEEEEEPAPPPDWLTKSIPASTPPSTEQGEPSIAPAELPTWLEALRPTDAVSPTGPMEDVSSADIVTAGPLVGLRGVISARPSAIRARKPPTYSIKLRVTEEQQARVSK